MTAIFRANGVEVDEDTWLAHYVATGGPAELERALSVTVLRERRQAHDENRTAHVNELAVAPS